MNIPVFEITQPQNFTKVVEASVVPTSGGVLTTVKRVRLYAPSDDSERLPKQLPCNYKTIDKSLLKRLLKDTNYGIDYVSSHGDMVAEYANR